MSDELNFAYDLVIIGGKAVGLPVAVSSLRSGLPGVRILEPVPAVVVPELVGEAELDVGYGEWVESAVTAAAAGSRAVPAAGFPMDHFADRQMPDLVFDHITFASKPLTPDPCEAVAKSRFPDPELKASRSVINRRHRHRGVIEGLRTEHYTAAITQLEPTHSDPWVLRVRSGTSDGGIVQPPRPDGVVEILERSGFRLDRRNDPGNIHHEKYWCVS